MRISFFLAGVLIFLSISCSAPPAVKLPFDFSHPAEVIKLPQRLHEISGISFYRKNELACVQDEKGVIFFYNIKKDKLRNNIAFAKDKDYEGIANVNDTLFVLCSNGMISEIDSTNETGYANNYSNFLSKDNNCEGLCFDEKQRRLLVACKGKPKKGTAPKGMKAIYGFSLETRKMDETPVYVIDPDSVNKHFLNDPGASLTERLFGKKHVDAEFQFEPSELCIDPFTNDIYVLSSVGKSLLVMSYDGIIKFAIHLDPEIFKQPEGLTFSSDGSMFISDEGRGGKANLIKLRRNPRMIDYKNIIFDLGGVILDIDYRKTIEAFKNLGVEDAGILYSKSSQISLFDDLEKGNITEEDFYKRIKRLSKIDLSNSQIRDAWNAILIGLNDEIVQLLFELKKEKRVFLLSNTNCIHEKAYREMITKQYGRFIFDELFEKMYLSHHLHLRKPDPEIFKYVLSDAGLLKNDTCFIDDSPQHVEAARSIGISSFHLKNNTLIELFNNGEIIFTN